MKVYEMTVDKRPEWCLFCPLKASAIRLEMPSCGAEKTIKQGDWEQGGKAPDERCLLKEY